MTPTTKKWAVIIVIAVLLLGNILGIMHAAGAFEDDDPKESFSSYSSQYEVDEEEDAEINTRYILNTSSMKIHKKRCASAKRISDENKGYITDKYTVSDALDDGYTYCGNCLD